MGYMVLCRTFHTVTEQGQGPTPIVSRCSGSSLGPSHVPDRASVNTPEVIFIAYIRSFREDNVLSRDCLSFTGWGGVPCDRSLPIPPPLFKLLHLWTCDSLSIGTLIKLQPIFVCFTTILCCHILETELCGEKNFYIYDMTLS